MRAIRFHKTGGLTSSVHEEVADPTPKDGEAGRCVSSTAMAIQPARRKA
jgi:NADPH:quinone reductase-like Zn-dependent oxidoreductase